MCPNIFVSLPASEIRPGIKFHVPCVQAMNGYKMATSCNKLLLNIMRTEYRQCFGFLHRIMIKRSDVSVEHTASTSRVTTLF